MGDFGQRPAIILQQPAPPPPHSAAWPRRCPPGTASAQTPNPAAPPLPAVRGLRVVRAGNVTRGPCAVPEAMAFSVGLATGLSRSACACAASCTAFATRACGLCFSAILTASACEAASPARKRGTVSTETPGMIAASTAYKKPVGEATASPTVLRTGAVENLVFQKKPLSSKHETNGLHLSAGRLAAARNAFYTC